MPFFLNCFFFLFFFINFLSASFHIIRFLNFLVGMAKLEIEVAMLILEASLNL